ncbi:MAG: hypothetical protein ACI84O_000965 [Myxococcota bacterium]|jgi:hypothetical protein
MKCLTLLALLSIVACSQATSGRALELQKHTFENVIDQHLESASAWPDFGIERADEIFDTLDMLQLGGSLAQRAQRRISRLAANDIYHALLLTVENHRLDVERRRQAYLMLHLHFQQDEERFIPRLILRIKYEKDWLSNVYIAQALANVGNLSGLDPVLAILRSADDPNVVDLDRAKLAGADFIAVLNNANLDFAENWNHALELQKQWDENRSIHKIDENTQVSRHQQYRDELWHLVADFRSQPLRPVDNARFVFTRLSYQAHSVLAEAASDSNRYVRDHCLQTFTWMNSRVADLSYPQLAESLKTLETDFYTTVRAIEYRGALMSKSQAEFLWPILINGNYEQRTAAADALLRSSDVNNLQITDIVIDERFSPEAQFSLRLLRAELNAAEVESIDALSLDRNEEARRRRWQQQRLDLDL